MSKQLTAVMYHYVKDVEKTDFPRIKALKVEQFKKQIDYFEKYYKFVSIQELMDAVSGGNSLPKNSILLTFDDGYRDMYTNVFPLLRDRKIEGSFFVPGKAIAENSVLIVNKIQHVLARLRSLSGIKNELKKYILKFKTEFCLDPYNMYYEQYAVADNLDGADVVFIKKMLSFVLPVDCRNLIVNELFKKYVCDDEIGFAKSLYLNRDQIKEMRDGGMYIGCHGYEHYWLGEISREEQIVDIDKSLNFLSDAGCSVEEWAIAYPYESYNNELIEVIKSKGCKVGFVEGERIANYLDDSPFQLPRLDTNEFPPKCKNSISKWTKLLSDKSRGDF